MSKWEELTDWSYTRTPSKEKRKKRMKELIENIDRWLKFDLTYHFGLERLKPYRSVLSMRREQSLDDLLNNRLYLRKLRHTLIKWDMNKRGAKLKPFDQFESSVLSNKKEFLRLSNHNLGKLDDFEYEEVRDRVEELFYQLDIMVSQSKLVANSKLMHFILPNLITPVDRQHVLKFFYDRKQVQDKKFLEIFGLSHEIAKRGDLKKYLDSQWNQSIPKIIDSAIIGYVRTKFY